MVQKRGGVKSRPPSLPHSLESMGTAIPLKRDCPTQKLCENFFNCSSSQNASKFGSSPSPSVDRILSTSASQPVLMGVAGYSDEASDGDYDPDECESEYEPEDDGVRRITECHEKLLKDATKSTKPSLPLDRISTDLTGKGKGGKTVLHLIATKSSSYSKLLPLIPWLLESAENQVLLSAADDDGSTALDRAVSRKMWDMVECLLRFDGFVKAAVLASERSPENTCLHELVTTVMEPARSVPKRKDSPKTGTLDPLWKCIDKLVSEPMKGLMMVKGNKGNTPLHLAVACCGTTTFETQQKLISKITSACPESMKMRNDSGQSPYQYRVQSLSTPDKDAAKLELELKQDRILFYLKDKYMHYPSRDEAAKYLYGNGRGEREWPPSHPMKFDFEHMSTEHFIDRLTWLNCRA